MINGWLDPATFALLARGLVLTVVITLVTTFLSLVLGVLVGMLRLTEDPIGHRIATLHIELHRNVPALVLIIFWAYAVPNLFPSDLRRHIFYDNWLVHWLSEWTHLSIPYYTVAAVVALTLNTSAYLAELYRTGVGTIAREHLESARTLGASFWTIFVHILLPEGMRAAFPAITTRLIHNMKNTSLAALVAVPELYNAIQTGISRTFRAVEYLLLAALLYLVLSFTMSAMLGWVQKYLTQRQGVLNAAQKA